MLQVRVLNQVGDYKFLRSQVLDIQAEDEGNLDLFLQEKRRRTPLAGVVQISVFLLLTTAILK